MEDVPYYYHDNKNQTLAFPQVPEVLVNGTVRSTELFDLGNTQVSIGAVIQMVNAKLENPRPSFSVPPRPIHLEWQPNLNIHGLFSTREIKEGEFITYFGGIIIYGTERKGAYTIYDAGVNRSWDASRYFRLTDVGRWINKPPLSKKEWANVKGAPQEGNTDRYILWASKNIPAGTELWFDYNQPSEYDIEHVLKVGDEEKLEMARRSLDTYFGLHKHNAARELVAYKERVDKALNLLQKQCNFCTKNAAQDAFSTKGGGRFCSQRCRKTWELFFKKN